MKKIAPPSYEPMTWDGEQYVVLANPSLRLLEGLSATRTVAGLVEFLTRIIRAHPYVNDDESPADLLDVDAGELKRFVGAYTAWLNDLPKA